MQIPRQQFLSHLKQEYPELSKQNPENLDDLVSDNLLSPFAIELPNTVLKQAKEIIETLFHLSHQGSYIEFYSEEIKKLGLTSPGNHGVMMSYDFHLDSAGVLKLIEVNTNASFLILGIEFYKMKNKKSWPEAIETADLKQCILNELKLNAQNKTQPRIAIVDDQPQEQRLYAEFIVAREVFKSFGFPTDILETSDSSIGKYDFVYNRDTDFYFQGARTEKLKPLYESRKICVSPHPFEYFLLADKQRMIDWGQEKWRQAVNVSSSQAAILEKHIPASFGFSDLPSEQIWDRRRNFFFKPKRAFGSKQSYKGSSISRKTFEALNRDEMMGQEYIPAPEIEKSMDNVTQKFKYDLRCYAYEGQLQLVMARLYQGQVTNLRTPLGGFATVHFQN